MAVICVQIILIVALYFQIQNTKNNTLGISINTIDSKTIRKTPSEKLKYFFEPKANNIQEIHNNWLSFVPRYTINNDTLNERFNYLENKEKNIFRIITLGDSYTFGQYIATEDNWTELLENSLNSNNSCKNKKKYEVINLGVPGYDIQYEVERYLRRGKKYNPDLIIWMLIDNSRIMEELTPLIEACNINNSKFNNDSNNVPNYICWENAERALNKRGRAYIDQFLTEEFNKIFKLYDKKIIAIDWNNSHSNILKNISKPGNVYIYPYFPSNNNEDKLPDRHPSAEGHKTIAEEIFTYLQKNNLLPCGK